jgi:hypothetical protein
MAALAILGQQALTYDGASFLITKCRLASSSDTITVATGVLSASALGASSDLAVAATAGATSDTLTITGGSAATGVVYVVSRHGGHASGMGAR